MLVSFYILYILDKSKLKTLILRGNRLELIRQDVFSDLEELESVDLSSNRLSYLLQIGLLDRPTLKSIQLKDNPFQCNRCYIAWIRNLNASVFVDHAETMCFEPVELRNTPAWCYSLGNSDCSFVPLPSADAYRFCSAYAESRTTESSSSRTAEEVSFTTNTKPVTYEESATISVESTNKLSNTTVADIFEKSTHDSDRRHSTKAPFYEDELTSIVDNLDRLTTTHSIEIPLEASSPSSVNQDDGKTTIDTSNLRTSMAYDTESILDESDAPSRRARSLTNAPDFRSETSSPHKNSLVLESTLSHSVTTTTPPEGHTSEVYRSRSNSEAIYTEDISPTQSLKVVSRTVDDIVKSTEPTTSPETRSTDVKTDLNETSSLLTEPTASHETRFVDVNTDFSKTSSVSTEPTASPQTRFVDVNTDSSKPSSVSTSPTTSPETGFDYVNTGSNETSSVITGPTASPETRFIDINTDSNKPSSVSTEPTASPETRFVDVNTDSSKPSSVSTEPRASPETGFVDVNTDSNKPSSVSTEPTISPKTRSNDVNTYLNETSSLLTEPTASPETVFADVNTDSNETSYLSTLSTIQSILTSDIINNGIKSTASNTIVPDADLDYRTTVAQPSHMSSRSTSDVETYTAKTSIDSDEKLTTGDESTQSYSTNDVIFAKTTDYFIDNNEGSGEDDNIYDDDELIVLNYSPETTTKPQQDDNSTNKPTSMTRFMSERTSNILNDSDTTTPHSEVDLISLTITNPDEENNEPTFSPTSRQNIFTSAESRHRQFSPSTVEHTILDEDRITSATDDSSDSSTRMETSRLETTETESGFLYPTHNSLKSTTPDDIIPLFLDGSESTTSSQDDIMSSKSYTDESSDGLLDMTSTESQLNMEIENISFSTEKYPGEHVQSRNTQEDHFSEDTEDINIMKRGEQITQPYSYEDFSVNTDDITDVTSAQMGIGEEDKPRAYDGSTRVERRTEESTQLYSNEESQVTTTKTYSETDIGNEEILGTNDESNVTQKMDSPKDYPHTNKTNTTNTTISNRQTTSSATQDTDD